MAPYTDSQRRWQTAAKEAFGSATPEWTMADDNDNEYDVHIYRKHMTRSRVRRNDGKVTSTEPANAQQTNDSSQDESEDEGESDSEESEPEDDAEDEAEDEAEEEAEDENEVEIENEAENAGNAALPATDAPSLAAPSAEGSVSDSGRMVEGGDGLHSNVHKILLGVGSVGGFLLLLGIGFVVWKCYAKRNAQKKAAPVDDMSFEKPGRFETLVSKIPFIGSRFGHQNWYTIQEPSHTTVEKAPAELPVTPTVTPRRPNSLLSVPGKTLGAYRIDTPKTTRSTFYIDTVSPTSTTFVESTAVQVQVVARHDPKETLTPSHRSQHKRMPSTTPYAYDVGRRQTGASELSSISSGFGDGDIVVTPTYQTIQSVPSRPTPSRQPTWKSTSSLTRRDTTSTMASVETRPRFHSVNSWVRQQNGELRRAQRQQESSPDSDTPPVPAFPPEQDFRYMLPDDERPRPVEMV
ncbi:hypothetical protein F66182_4895 [Fusarium sp. NRRL 66182]|nr:hypothetical protein F66182_4895 [Fusarium sp. NRRL 66182]